MVNLNQFSESLYRVTRSIGTFEEKQVFKNVECTFGKKKKDASNPFGILYIVSCQIAYLYQRRPIDIFTPSPCITFFYWLQPCMLTQVKLEYLDFRGKNLNTYEQHIF